MKRRVCAILLAASLAVCGLTGCGNGSQSSAGQEKVRLMVWSPSEDQSKESGEWLQTMCESFAEENPQWILHLCTELQMKRRQRVRYRRIRKQVRMYLCMQ